MAYRAFKGVIPNVGRVLVKEFQPHVVDKSQQQKIVLESFRDETSKVMNKRLDETRNKHVRKATVLAHGKRNLMTIK